MPEAAAGVTNQSAAPSASTSGDSGWSEQEQLIAREAFERAQQRAIASLVETLRDQVAALDDVTGVWALHDYLSTQRHTMEGRFDFRLPGLLFVFASLVRDELLSLEELEGLDAVKLAKIAAMSRI